MSQAINQQFTVEILSTAEDETQTKIAPALCAAVIGWEREFNEDDESDVGDTDFLVGGDDDGHDEDTDDEDDGDEPEYEVAVSDSVLNLTTTVSAEVLNDIKSIQAMDADERLVVRIVYGTSNLIRQFTISPDLGVLLSSGDKSDEALVITVVGDVYDSETIF